MRDRDSASSCRWLKWTVNAAALIMLGGCATLTVVPADRLEGQQLTPNAEPVAHIYAANWGVYLFKYLPPIHRKPLASWRAEPADPVQR